jgi:hypothetical protein
VNKTIEQKITIDEVPADTAYSGKGNLSFLQTEEIKASIPKNIYNISTIKKGLNSTY